MTTKHRRKPYMPDDDYGKKVWMERFITTIERDPERYGFNDPRMLESSQRTIRTFIKAFDTVSSPGTRTPGAVRAKNNARKEAVAVCRDIAMRLKWDSSLTNEDKQALGIDMDEARPEKAKLPKGKVFGSAGFPKLNVLSSPNGGHVIRYSDSVTESKAKPKGVSHLLLFGAIGDKPMMPRSRAQFMSPYTKSPFEVLYPIGCGIEGMHVTYYGRWLTTRGAMSPWSPGVSKIISDTTVRLRECPFEHLFGTDSAVDAQPALPAGEDRRLAQDAAHVVDDDPPLLERSRGEESAGQELFAALEATTVRLLNAG